MSVFIIAEAGVNHNGDFETALDLAAVAKDLKADAVKFQTFWGFPKFKHLELTRYEWQQLKEYCDKIGIEFMSTPDTIEAVGFLAELGMLRWKVGSRNTTDDKFLNAINAMPSKAIYLSTGMCTAEEVNHAVLWTLGLNGNKIYILHCVSQYPTPYEVVNLSAMPSLHAWHTCEFGLSDHTLGIHIPIAAVAMGASVIEKHFTLDKTLDGPDHAMSLAPQEFAEMVRCIRDVEVAMGDGKKNPTEYELTVRDRVRNYEDCREQRRWALWTLQKVT